MTDLFKGLAKKKKSKKSKDAEAADGGDDAPPAADGEFDATALKKKKKKKTPKATDGDDFDARLAEAGVGDEDDGADANGSAKDPALEEGDLDKGTGIWAHNAKQPISYPLLLTRFFTLLHNHHPDILSSGSKSYKIPPPQCLREGNKKTIFANIADICKRIKRSDEHVTQFLFAELGTSGSVDGSRRLVIRGRFQQKQIENVLRRYIGKPQCLRVSDICANEMGSGICHLQDLPITRYRVEQRGESSLFRQLQLLSKPTKCHSHQDWFHSTSWQAQKAASLDLSTIQLWPAGRQATLQWAIPFLRAVVLP